MKIQHMAYALTLAGMQGAAGELLKGEYFIDSDPGYGNGTVFMSTPAQEYLGFFTLAPEVLETLTSANHLLGIRFQNDSGDWGETRMQRFSPAQAQSAVLARGEYFLNQDPGEGAGQLISADPTGSYDGEVVLGPSTLDSLLPGPNLIGFRFRDENDEWGATGFRLFDPASANEAKLSAGEYFINADPGKGLATSISLSGESSHGALLALSPTDLASLPVGMNLLGIRFQDSDGEWGNEQIRLFDNTSDAAHDLSSVSWKISKAGETLFSGSLLPNFVNRLDLVVREGEMAVTAGDLLLLEFQAMDSRGNGSSKVFREVTVGTMRQEFQDQYFTPGEQANEEIAGDLADPDGDGLVNLLEEALGLHPREGSSPVGQLLLSSDSRNFRFDSHEPLEFDEANSRFRLGSLSYQLLVSSDLENWAVAQHPADYELPEAPEASEGRYVQEFELKGAPGTCYYRLEIIRSE